MLGVLLLLTGAMLHSYNESIDGIYLAPPDGSFDKPYATLGLIVFILLYKQAPNNSAKTAPVTKQVVPSSKDAIKTVVSNFYTAFQDCMKTPPIQAEGQVSNYCQLNTGFTTTSFSSYSVLHPQASVFSYHMLVS